jgi:hypothetical protein
VTEPKGVIFFWNDEPHITGYLTIGDDHYELAGVKRSRVRADISARKIEAGEQTDLFEESE